MLSRLHDHSPCASGTCGLLRDRQTTKRVWIGVKFRVTGGGEPLSRQVFMKTWSPIFRTVATQWNEIYLNVFEVLLEPGGSQLQIFTEQQFLVLAGEVLTDFCNKTGLVKKIFNQVIQFGIAVYQEHGTMGDLESALANNFYLFESSGYYIDNTNPDWHNFAWANQPDRYREDELPPKSIELYPTPNVQGNVVGVVAGQGGYGVMSGTTLATDFNIVLSEQSPQGGYGTPCGYTGNPYVECANPGYGVVAVRIPSTGNLSMLGSALPWNVNNLTLQTYVELLPDSFTPYLKYGILARIFATDSEVKDQQKAAYCQARYAEGINLAAALMSDEYTEES